MVANQQRLTPAEKFVIWEYETAPDRFEPERKCPILEHWFRPGTASIIDRMGEAVRAVTMKYLIEPELPYSCPSLPLNERRRQHQAVSSPEGYLISSFSMNLAHKLWHAHLSRPHFKAYAAAMIRHSSFWWLAEWDPTLEQRYPRGYFRLPTGWRFYRPLSKALVRQRRAKVQ
jgi:hypothetical protein